MKSIIPYLAGTLGVLLPYGASAQQFVTAHSNYAGLGGVRTNPASVAGNSLAFQFYVAGLDVLGTNSAYSYAGKGNEQQSIAGFNLQGDNATPLTLKRPKLFSAGYEFRGPGLLVRLGPKAGLAVSTRVRSAFQGNNLSFGLLQNARLGQAEQNAWKNSSYNVNLNTYSEWAVTYGYVVRETGPHQIKVGATAKRLMGLESAFAQGQEVDYAVYPAISGVPNDDVFLVNKLEGSYGFARPTAAQKFDAPYLLRALAGTGAVGGGWGADLGVVYEYRSTPAPPEPAARKGKRAPVLPPQYQARVAVSVTDLGSIRYNKNTVAYRNLSLRDLPLARHQFSDVNLYNYQEKLLALYPTGTQPRENNFNAALPTALNIDLDYRFVRHLYLNGSLSHGLRGQDAVGMRSLSFATVTPRFESRWLELAVPVSLTNDYQQVAVGCRLRLGGLTIGSNNVASFLGSDHAYGTSAYFELALQLPARSGGTK